MFQDAFVSALFALRQNGPALRVFVMLPNE